MTASIFSPLMALSAASTPNLPMLYGLCAIEAAISPASMDLTASGLASKPTTTMPFLPADLMASIAPSAIRSLLAKTAATSGLAVRTFSITVWPLARSESAACLATTVSPHALNASSAPPMRSMCVCWLITPVISATLPLPPSCWQINSPASLPPLRLFVPMNVNASAQSPLVSTNNTGILAALALSNVGFNPLTSVGATMIALTFLVIWSSIWLIWVATSVSAGGANTTMSTLLAAAVSLAPFSTSAQNGLPPPGPFMLSKSVTLAAGAAAPPLLATTLVPVSMTASIFSPLM